MASLASLIYRLTYAGDAHSDNVRYIEGLAWRIFLGGSGCGCVYRFYSERFC